MGKISNLESFKTKLAENKTINNVLKLDGAEYIKTMQLLYSALNKDIAKKDKEGDELAESIKRLFNDRLKFIQYAWEDKNLIKKE